MEQDKEERYLPTSRKSQVYIQGAYLLVLLAFCWALALVVHMGGLGLVTDTGGGALSPFGTLMEYKGNLLAAALLTALGASGLRQSVKRLLLPDTKRLVLALAGYLFLSVPSPLTMGLYLLPAPLSVVAAIALCAAAVPPETAAHADTHRLLLGLCGAAALFLAVLFLIEVRPLLRRWTDARTAAARMNPVVDEDAVLEEAAVNITRLRPSAIEKIPKEAAAKLEKAGCLIPQSGFSSKPHNFFTVALVKPGSYDWVALCSKDGFTSVHVVYADPLDEADCTADFAPARETEDLQRVGKDRGAFNRVLKPAPYERLEEILGKDPEGGLPPLQPGLSAIEDRIVGKEARVHYCKDKAWVFSRREEKQAGPDGTAQSAAGDEPQAGTFIQTIMPHERDGIKLE